MVLHTEATWLPCLITAQQAGLTPDPLGHFSLTALPIPGPSRVPLVGSGVLEEG